MQRPTAGAGLPGNPLTTLLLVPETRGSILAESVAGQHERIGYCPYGTRVQPKRAQSRTGFNGQLLEPQGWYHLGHGHRAYNPALRRFHSPDRLSPFGDGGLNAYAYCLGDPVNHVDPTGRAANFMQIVTLIGVVAGIAAGATSLLGPALLKGVTSKAALTLVKNNLSTIPRGALVSSFLGPKGRIAAYAAKSPPVGTVMAGGLDGLATMVGMLATVPLGISTVHNIEQPMDMNTELAVLTSALMLFVAPVKLLASWFPVLPTSKSALRFSKLLHGREKVRVAQKKAQEALLRVRGNSAGGFPALPSAAPSAARSPQVPRALAEAPALPASLPPSAFPRVENPVSSWRQNTDDIYL
ncbi:RHS repeat-associated core domain-containing protein [Pseudomonas wadenswilerensis]